MSLLQQQQPDQHHQHQPPQPDHQHFGTRGRPTLDSIPDGHHLQGQRQPSSSTSSNCSPLPRPLSAVTNEEEEEDDISVSDISVVSSQSEALDLMKRT